MTRIRLVQKRTTYPQRQPSANAPTVLVNQVQTSDGLRMVPANDLAKALADAFGVDHLTDDCAEKLLLAGLRVEIDDPQPVYRVFKRSVA